MQKTIVITSEQYFNSTTELRGKIHNLRFHLLSLPQSNKTIIFLSFSGIKEIVPDNLPYFNHTQIVETLAWTLKNIHNIKPNPYLCT